MQVATGATATIPVGYGPGAIIFDGNYLWIANANDNTVAKMLPNGTAVAYETVGNGPSSLTFDGSSNLGHQRTGRNRNSDPGS